MNSEASSQYSMRFDRKKNPVRPKLFTACFARFHAAIIAVLFLPGCSHTNSVIDTACSWVQPIMVSREDVLTDDTARQILMLNEQWERTCEQK